MRCSSVATAETGAAGKDSEEGGTLETIQVLRAARTKLSGQAPLLAALGIPIPLGLDSPTTTTVPARAEHRRAHTHFPALAQARPRRRVPEA